MSNLEALHRRAKALNLHGLLAHWGEAAAAGWLATLIEWEEQKPGSSPAEPSGPFHNCALVAAPCRFWTVLDISFIICSHGVIHLAALPSLALKNYRSLVVMMSRSLMQPSSRLSQLRPVLVDGRGAA